MLRNMMKNQERSVLDQYMEEISKYEPLSPEEEIKLTKKIRQGDQEAFNKLIESNTGFVISQAKKWRKSRVGMSLIDIIQAGNIGLIKAATRFDETRGFKFISYAVWWVNQQILEQFGDKYFLTRRSPPHIVVQNKKVAILREKLENEYQHPLPPSFIDAGYLRRYGQPHNNISPSKLAFYKSATLTPTKTPHEKDRLSLLEILTDSNSEDPTSFIKEDSLKIICNEILNSLTKRQREIVERSWGLNGFRKMNYHEIGIELKITHQSAQQTYGKARTFLRRNKKTFEKIYGPINVSALKH